MSASRELRFGHYDYAAFLTFFSYASGSIVIPVALVALASDLGFSLDQGGMTAGGALGLGRAIPMVGSMLLCGFAAGRYGTRNTLGGSVLLMGLGMLLCAFAPGYAILFLALLVAGVGEGVIEGLATPFVQALHPDQHGRYINFAHSFWSIGVLVTVLVCGALLTLGVSWRWLLAGVSGLGFCSGVLILLSPRAGGQVYPDTSESTSWRQVWGHARQVIRLPRFWLYFAAMFLAGGGEFCLTFWSASHIQLRYDTAAWSGGLGTALFAAGMVLGRTGWAVVLRQHHLKALVVGSACAGTLVTLLLPTTSSLWIFCALLFLAGVATAPFWPSIQSHATHRLPQVDATMLLILLSCAGVPGCGVFTYLMGVLGNRNADLTAAFYLVPAAYAVLGVLIALDDRHTR